MDIEYFKGNNVNFKEIFTEFANKLDNTHFNISVGDSVEFLYKGETIEASVMELEDGKQGRVILIVDNPKDYKSKKDLKRSIMTHVSKLRSTNSKNKDLKEIKELQYV